MFVGKNGKPITEHTFQSDVRLDRKSINKERKKQAGEKTRQCLYRFRILSTCTSIILLQRVVLKLGLTQKVVQGFLGHYSIAITLDLYTHVTDDKAKSEMDKLQNLYKEII